MPPDPMDPPSSNSNSTSGLPVPSPTSATSGQIPVTTPGTAVSNPPPTTSGGMGSSVGSGAGGGGASGGGAGAGGAGGSGGGGTTPNPPPSATSAHLPSPSPSTPTLIGGMAGGPGGNTSGTTGGAGSSSATSAMSAQAAMAQAAHYRPLNVRDALTYLDQVKVQFADLPDVYNRFLDVMKEFKGQTIDTPGVIDRVSTLFHHHPSLIQGFNTFLPPGYRIECYTATDPSEFPPGAVPTPDNAGFDGRGMMLISVTTPSGTVSQLPGGFAKADRERKERERKAAEKEKEREREREKERERDREARRAIEREKETFERRERERLERDKEKMRYGDDRYRKEDGKDEKDERARTGFGTSSNSQPNSLIPTALPPIPPSELGLASRSNQAMNNTFGMPSGPSTPAAAQLLASGMQHPSSQHGHHQQVSSSGQREQLQSQGQQGPQRGAPAPMVEFNHAITFVNKIKNRFSGDQETYKQFLEILQTYQKETKDINEVYGQVTMLFNNAPDLLEEFTQFLPGADGQQAPGGLFGAAFLDNGLGMNGGMALVADKPPKRDGGRDKESGKDMGSVIAAQGVVPAKKRRGADKDGNKVGSSRSKKPKIAHREPTPSMDIEPLQQMNMQIGQAANQSGLSNVAAQSEVVFFERVKKAIDDKTTYFEFLKLLNLYVNDLIDQRTLVERAGVFLGGDGSDLFHDFKKLVGFEMSGIGNANYPPSALVSVDPSTGIIDNIPMTDRPRIELNNQKAEGPSYRKLPQHEVALACSGRDPMCWEVLNDEWVSHPTWASEEATTTTAHKRNAYEEALHKTEEERHEYDYHIEANVRTIALLEPIAARISQMEPEARETFKLKPGLGGQSKTIYQRILKKIYGRDSGQEVITALHDTPATAVPVVLERLKRKDEEWKKHQREWNKVWREVDAMNFYKSLDHQGTPFKVNDKKAIMPKALIAEVEAKRTEQKVKRASTIDSSAVSVRERSQYRFEVNDVSCLQDAVKMMIAYLDHTGTLSGADKERVENFLRSFIPLFFQFQDVDFDAAFAELDAAKGDDDSDDGTSDGGRSMIDEDDVSSNTSKRGKKNGGAASDLRTKLLRQAVGERNGTRLGSATPSPAPQSVDGTSENISSMLQPGEETLVTGGAGTVVPEASERGETPVPPPADPVEVAEAAEKDKAEADDGEKTWVQLDGAGGSGSNTPVVHTPTPRVYSFFANNHFFCFFRLLEIFYSRLKAFKDAATTMANKPNKYQPINPSASLLGLTDPLTAPILEGDNPAARFYPQLLDICEKLFDGEIDQVAYEEGLRHMFGIDAYPGFTFDKVIAQILKQVTTILGDVRSQELWALLQRDRASDTTTGKQQIAYRTQAERVLAPEENLFKISWAPHSKRVRILLMSKDDTTLEDPASEQERWQAYTDSFALIHDTEGLHHRVDPPFLNRTLVTLPDDCDEEVTSGLGVRIAFGNYRMFFVQNTGDSYHRCSTPAEEAETTARLGEKTAERAARMEKWLKGDNGDEDAAARAATVALTEDVVMG